MYEHAGIGREYRMKKHWKAITQKPMNGLVKQLNLITWPKYCEQQHESSTTWNRCGYY